MIAPTANDLYQLGCSFIPVLATKKPAGKLLPQRRNESTGRSEGEWKPYQKRKPNPDEIQDWEQAKPAAYAIVTGEISGRVTFDFDGAVGVALAQKWGIKPHRRTGSGGLHLDVEHPGWHVPTLNGKAKAELGKRWPGLDVKGDGGYCIAIGRNEKGSYEWLREPVPDASQVVPAEVWAFLKECSNAIAQPNVVDHNQSNGFGAKSDSQRVDSELLITRALESARSVGRNNAGFELACQLRDNGYSESESLSAVLSYQSRTGAVNTKGEREPYTDAEVTATVGEVFNRPAREPWQQRATMHEPTKSPSFGIDLLKTRFNDHGNAERLCMLYGHKLRYCHQSRKWLVYDGRRWAVDKTGQAKQTAKQAMLEFITAAGKEHNDQAEKFAIASLNRKSIDNLLAMAESDLPVKQEDLDQHPYLLNCLNGTVDLTSGRIYPHSPDQFITKLVHCEYKPDARCPVFVAAVARMMGAGPEASNDELARADRLVSYLQKAFGYSMTGVTSEKVVFFCHGDGNNGKTTLLHTFHLLLEEYATLLKIDTLMTHRPQEPESNNTMSDKADLCGARFAMTSETEEGQRLSEGKLKRITQGMGKIKAGRKYQELFEFEETHKLWFDANHKPEIRGTDPAIWNRLHLIPFPVTFKKDPTLRAKLDAEAEGILAWAVAGAVRWQKEGLGTPPEVSEAVEQYREEMDQIGRFIAERCILAQTATARAHPLYTAYRKWAESNGEIYVAGKTFGERLTKRNIPKGHDSAGWYYTGIGINDEQQ